MAKAKQVGKPQSLQGFLPGSIFTISDPDIGISHPHHFFVSVFVIRARIRLRAETAFGL